MARRLQPSQYMTDDEAEAVIRSATFSACDGKRLNFFVTVNTALLGIWHQHDKFFTGLLKRFDDWQRTLVSNYRPRHVGVVEAVGGIHLHCLLHVDEALLERRPKLLRTFHWYVRRWVKQTAKLKRVPKNAVLVEHVSEWEKCNSLDQYYEAGLRHTLAYMVKGVGPNSHDKFRVRPQHRVWQGLVPTKRIWISVALHHNGRSQTLRAEMWKPGPQYLYVPRPILSRFQLLKALRLTPRWLIRL